MAEFNGKKFYGFSLHNDPALTTTTRNFEFRYTRPEQLERTIQRVQMIDDPSLKQRKSAMLNKCYRLRKQLSPISYTRDRDVETHISRQDCSRVRALSENEVDQLIGKVKSRADLTDNKSIRCISSTVTSTGEESQCYVTPEEQEEDMGDHLRVRSTMQSAKQAEYRAPQPKWVEILEKPQVGSVTVADVIQPFMEIVPRNNESARNPSMDRQMHMAVPIMNVGLIKYEDMNTQAYYDVVEDSDLEFELMGRSHYTKFCGPKPASEEMPSASNNSEAYPQFIEIEAPHINAMSFLKNVAPIRYTDYTEEVPDDGNINIDNQQLSAMKIFIKGIKSGDEVCNVEHKSEKDGKKKSHKTKEKHAEQKNSQKQARSKNPKLSEIDRNGNGGLSARPKASKFNVPRSPTAMKDAARAIYGNNSGNNTERAKDRSRQKLQTGPRTIEELKLEKMSIFSKMTCMQERIIDLLDKLRFNLLEIYVPDSSYEKSRRQKNAFEFSVRFSRNFLYPLKGMIEDLRQVSVEQLNSSASNEACGRVCSIYSLILQSLQTYQKQLRYFLLDQVPQKLTTLIEMIHTTTSLCLEKSIFDKNDAIIDCLQERCTKFHGFLEDMHEERFLTARENYRKSYNKKNPKYDLKMFMNNLNMYEPKLVPRHSSRRVTRKASRKHQGIPNKYEREDSSMERLISKNSESIATQIENGYDMYNENVPNSLHNMVSSSNEGLEGKMADISNILTEASSDIISNPLNKAIFEALQLVTKEQVRQVMQPIIQSLGTALDKKKNSEIIETILSAFNSKFISTIQAGPNKHYDPECAEVAEDKVVGGISVNCKDSVCLLRNASKASKAAKRTKHSKKIHQRESLDDATHETVVVAPNMTAHRPVTVATNHDDVNDDDGDADDDNDDYSSNGRTGGEADSGGDNNSTNVDEAGNDCNKNNKTNNNNNTSNIVSRSSSCTSSSRSDHGKKNSISDCHNKKRNAININNNKHKIKNAANGKTPKVGASRRSDVLESGQSGLDVTPRNDNNANKNRLLNVIVMNSNKSRSHTQQFPLNRTATMAAINAATEQLTLQELLQQQQRNYVSHKSKEVLHKTAANAKRTQRTISASSSSATTSNETLRNRASERRPSARFNKRLFKKRRDPMLSPPPAPAGTPSTSARSAAKREKEIVPDSTPESVSGVNVGVPVGGNVPTPVKTYIEHEREQYRTQLGQSDSMESCNTPSPINDKIAPSIPLTRNFISSPEISPPEDLGDDLTADDDESKCYNSVIRVDVANTKENNACNDSDFLSANSTVNLSKSRSVFGPAFKDIKERSLPLYIDESPYRTVRSANEQLTKLQKLQQDIRTQEKKQQEQLRTLGELNNVAGKISGKPPPEEIKCDDISARDNAADDIEEKKKPNLRIADMLKERDDFMQLCSRNRFYSNPNYEEPWKVFSRISDKLANEIVNAVEEDFTVGVSQFVKDFLEMETAT